MKTEETIIGQLKVLQLAIEKLWDIVEEDFDEECYNYTKATSLKNAFYNIESVIINLEEINAKTN